MRIFTEKRHVSTQKEDFYGDTNCLRGEGVETTSHAGYRCIPDFTVNISSLFIIFTDCGILCRIYWLTSYWIFNLELLVLRYMCKRFPLSLLYEKITVQDRLLQNIDYFARNKQQDDSGFTKTQFTNDLEYNMLHVLIFKLCNVCNRPNKRAYFFDGIRCISLCRLQTNCSVLFLFITCLLLLCHSQF